MYKNIRFKGNGNRAGSIMLYTLLLLFCIMFLGTYLITLQLNTFKYFNEQYKNTQIQNKIESAKEYLLTDFYNFVEEKSINTKDFNKILEKINGYKYNKIIDISSNDKGLQNKKNIIIQFKDGILYIDYKHKDNLYIHEKYSLEYTGIKFLLNNVNNNISSEENNY